MAAQNVDGIYTAVAGVDLTAFQRVTIDSGSLAQIAGATVRGAGVVQRDVTATIAEGTGIVNAPIRLLNHPGTFFMILNGTCANGDALYGAASGKVGTSSASGANPLIGQAMQAGADGDVIEVLPQTVA